MSPLSPWSSVNVYTNPTFSSVSYLHIQFVFMSWSGIGYYNLINYIGLYNGGTLLSPSVSSISSSWSADEDFGSNNLANQSAIFTNTSLNQTYVIGPTSVNGTSSVSGFNTITYQYTLSNDLVTYYPTKSGDVNGTLLTNYATFGPSGGGQNFQYNYGSSPTAFTNWTHLVITILYINGAIPTTGNSACVAGGLGAGYSAGTQTTPRYPLSGIYPFVTLGSTNYGAWNGLSFFRGNISNFRFYNRLLSASDVFTLYRSLS
jgi:hypothetical protein